MKNNKFFVKREKIFLHRQSLADASQQFSNLPRHLRRYLSYADANCKGCKAAILKRPLNNSFFWNLANVLGQHLKGQFWIIMFQHIIQPIRITPRYWKLSPLVFCGFCALYKSKSQRSRLDTTLYTDQNVSQTCQPEFSKIWRKHFFIQKAGDQYPHHYNFFVC